MVKSADRFSFIKCDKIAAIICCPFNSERLVHFFSVMSLLSFQWMRKLRHEEMAKLFQALRVSAEAEGHSLYLSPFSLQSTSRASAREKAILYYSFLFHAVYSKVKFTSLPGGCFAGPFGRWFMVLCKDLSDLRCAYPTSKAALFEYLRIIWCLLTTF